MNMTSTTCNLPPIGLRLWASFSFLSVLVKATNLRLPTRSVSSHSSWFSLPKNVMESIFPMICEQSSLSNSDEGSASEFVMLLRFLIALSDRLVYVSIHYKLRLIVHHLEWYLLDDNMCNLWDIVILELLFALNIEGRKWGWDNLGRIACLGHVFFCKAWGGGTWLSKGWSGKLGVEWTGIASKMLKALDAERGTLNMP